MSAYAASKVLAYNRTLEFVEEEKPAFTVTHFMSSVVVGKNELAAVPETVVAGSNAIAMTNLLGKQNPSGITATTVRIDDVAFVHVKSLDSNVERGQKSPCNSQRLGGIVQDDSLETGLLPCNGLQASNKVKYDAQKT